MQIETIRNDTEREVKVLLSMKDTELHALADPHELVPIIQARLAMAVVDKIMEKVGSELDRILGDKK